MSILFSKTVKITCYIGIRSFYYRSGMFSCSSVVLQTLDDSIPTILKSRGSRFGFRA